MAIISETSKVRRSRENILYHLIDDGAAAANSDEIKGVDAEAATLIVVSGAGVSGGVVLLEGAPTTGYTGTWKSLASLTINAANTVFSQGIGIIDELPMPYLRARISTPITGGTVDVYLAVRR